MAQKLHKWYPPGSAEPLYRMSWYFAYMLKGPWSNFWPTYEAIEKKKVFLDRPNTYGLQTATSVSC